LYGEYDYANGDKIRQPWAVNTGIRWQWGGKSEEAMAVPQPSAKQPTGKEEEPKPVEQPSIKTEPWQITVGGPGWLAGVSGTTGFHGINSNVDVGGLQANNMAIGAASTQLVDQFAQQLTTPGSNLQNLIQQKIVNKLTSLDGHNPELPVGPIASGQKGKIRNLIRQVIGSQEPQRAAAIRTGAQGRANQLKAQLASQVANSLTGQLNRSFSFYDSWLDPLIGLRGRFNLSKAFYLTAESDVGGFGIGSDIAGCQSRVLEGRIVSHHTAGNAMTPETPR
jgi:hypothetical protein